MDQSTLSEGPIVDRAGWTAHGASDIGHRRGRNEDRFILMPEAAAYIVCDGMGGHPGGAEASLLASQAARDSLAGDTGAPADRVSQAARAAAVAVRRVADETPALASMGTTLTLAQLDPTAGRAWLEQIVVDGNRHGRSHQPRESALLYKLDRIHRIDRTPKMGSIDPDPV